MLDHHGWHPLCHLELARHRCRHHGEFQPLGRSNGRYEPSRLGAGRSELFLLRKLLGRRLLCRTLAIECYIVFCLFVGLGLVSNLCVFLNRSPHKVKLWVCCGSLPASLDVARPAAASCPMWSAPARPASSSTSLICASLWGSLWLCGP